MVVADKPHGMPTQRTAGGEPGLVEHLSEELGIGLTLHHRLDQPASGVVVFGAHPHANRGLANGFRTHTIRREYRAVLAGQAEAGAWDWPVQGKAARTEVSVEATAAGMTAVRVTLRTGRKHQIRVHAAMAGVPIVGDRRYGGEVGRAWPRLALHAARLTMTHPVTGDALEFTAPLPADLTDLWARVGG